MSGVVLPSPWLLWFVWFTVLSIETVMLTKVTEGLYMFHSTCNSPIRNQSAPLFKEVIAVASIALVALILRFITRLPPLSVEWGIDDWLAAALVVRIP